MKGQVMRDSVLLADMSGNNGKPRHHIKADSLHKALYEVFNICHSNTKYCPLLMHYQNRIYKTKEIISYWIDKKWINKEDYDKILNYVDTIKDKVNI
jgi:hypothetical protein